MSLFRRTDFRFESFPLGYASLLRSDTSSSPGIVQVSNHVLGAV